MGFPITEAEHDASEAMIAGLPELIVAAAVKEGGCVVMVERPGRHGNCLNWFSGQGVRRPTEDCGFVTSRGRFVDREEAGRIVVAAGQASPRTEPTGINPRAHLFSEDVWND